MIAIVLLCGWLVGSGNVPCVSASPLPLYRGPEDATKTLQERYGIAGKLQVISATIDDRSAGDGPVFFKTECKLLRPGTYVFHFTLDHPFGKGSDARQFRIVFPNPTTQPAMQATDSPEFVLGGKAKPDDLLQVNWDHGNGAAGTAGWELKSIQYEKAP